MNYAEMSKEQLIEELLKKDNETINLEKQVVKSEHKSVHLTEKIKLMEINPSLAEKAAEMEYMLSMASKFAISKAFNPSYTPEQIYVIMKCGKEMGMSEIQSLQALYVVNGQINFFGDKMIARLTQSGYRIEWVDEVTTPGKEEVTVIVRSPDGMFSAKETATSKDQIILKSKAAQFALKNKLRFHAIRMVASFHLPHLFQSVSDMFSSEYAAAIDVTNEDKGYLPEATPIPTRGEANTEEIGFDINQDHPVKEEVVQETEVEIKPDWAS